LFKLVLLKVFIVRVYPLNLFAKFYFIAIVIEQNLHTHILHIFKLNKSFSFLIAIKLLLIMVDVASHDKYHEFDPQQFQSFFFTQSDELS